MTEAEELIQTSKLRLPLSKKKLISSLIPRVGFSSYPWLAQALPLGGSRFGGPADLPAGVDWPTVDGRPLLFLTQLNFAQLPIKRDHPLLKLLPKRGWFCLFVDLDGGTRRNGGIVALQFSGKPEKLVRHNPKPGRSAQVWTQCHAATIWPADHHLCLPDVQAVESPLPERTSKKVRDKYDKLRYEIEDLARLRHEVTLLGSPTLFNPDPRRSLSNPKEWMLLFEFRGECSWLAGAQPPEKHLDRPTLGSADFLQYFVRRSDFDAGRLNRGSLGWMLT